VAQVGSVKVMMSEYSDAYKRLYNRYRMLYADRFDENVLNGLKLKEKAIDQVVEKHLLLLKAKELHIAVSDREFSEYVQSIAAFTRNGRFDPEDVRTDPQAGRHGPQAIRKERARGHDRLPN